MKILVTMLLAFALFAEESKIVLRYGMTDTLVLEAKIYSKMFMSVTEECPGFSDNSFTYASYPGGYDCYVTKAQAASIEKDRKERAAELERKRKANKGQECAKIAEGALRCKGEEYLGSFGLQRWSQYFSTNANDTGNIVTLKPGCLNCVYSPDARANSISPPKK